ncbi:hypothetical protein [Prosthecomicrobium pneumaticum]|uniref:Uncharacterized protein n=1 Tax=Prosthecomicrobium pneumaticum TaxID=81895 RepID=A0A7W9FPR1_9HYPH|nr:hypothetical protein [Prosthecomicrobium pneumaticum]MBB5754531.1 hypothetical protein [Prosthecomicrobium pneumaticum]
MTTFRSAAATAALLIGLAGPAFAQDIEVAPPPGELAPPPGCEQTTVTTDDGVETTTQTTTNCAEPYDDAPDPDGTTVIIR